MDRWLGFAGDGSDGFNKGLNRRGWVAVFNRWLLCRAWSARFGSCLVSEVLVMLGRRGLGFAFWSVWVTEWVFFFFFFFNMGFCFDGILVSSGQWWHGGHGGGAVMEVEGRWRRKLEKNKK